jgi:polysaccharide export outer membrane protein
MRRHVQARCESSGARLTVAPAATLVALAWCALVLAGCGPTLGNDFTALDPPPAAGERPSGLTAHSADTKPAARAAEKLTSAATPGSNGYKIGPLDVIEFSVFKVAELARTAQVSEVGTVNLPLVGEVQVAGKTAQEMERDLARKLGAKYLQSPQVTVLVKEYNSQRVTVEGAVRKPGVYPIRGKTTLLQVIATAEGLDSQSDTTVVVFRQVEGKRMAARFDVGQIRSGQSGDPAIQSGDVVVAPTSATKATFDVILRSLPIATVFALL